MANIQIRGAQIKDSAITTEKLFGSIPDSKLAQLSTANKVALSAIDLDTATDIGAALADADLIFVDDGGGGTNRKAALSRLPTYLFAKVSGDATIASSGALTIAAGAVENSMLADDAVGADELASDAVVTASIVDANVTTAKLAADAVTGAKLADDAVDSEHIAAGAIDTEHIASAQITLAKMAANSVDSDQYVDGSIDTAHIADAQITLVKMADNSVDSDQYVDGSIDTAHLGDAQVTTAKIADDAVDADKLAADAVVFSSVASSAYTTNLKSSASTTEFALASAIKDYVDSNIAGLAVKSPVSAAYTASFTMASTASNNTLVLADGEGGFDASADTLTVDGVSVGTGKRVLVKDGVNSNGSGVHNKWNGVYTVGDLSGDTVTLTRADDFNEDTEFSKAPFFMVRNGSKFGAHGFVCSNGGSVTLGTDPVTFYQFSAPGQDAVAGDGIAKSGNVLSVDIDELTALSGTGLHQTQDFFMFSDNGTEKKISFSNLEDAIFGNLSGDVSVAAGGAVTIANDAVTAAKLGATLKQKLHTVSGGSETTLDLDEPLDASHNKPIVYKNGLALIPADSPSTFDEYSVSINGGGSGNARITFGAALSVGDIVLVLYIG